MDHAIDADALHRLVKADLDRGDAGSLAQAIATFQGYKLHLIVDAEALASPSHHVALLTAVALARRVFLGGVTISGVSDVPCLAPFPLCRRLADAVCLLGGKLAAEESDIRVQIGGRARRRRSDFHVRTAFAGWRGGVLPVEAPGPPVSPPMALSPMP